MKILTKKTLHKIGANILACQIMINRYESVDMETKIEIYEKLSENLCSLACDIGGIEMAYAIKKQAFPESEVEE